MKIYTISTFLKASEVVFESVSQTLIRGSESNQTIRLFNQIPIRNTHVHLQNRRPKTLMFIFWCYKLKGFKYFEICF